MTDSTAALDDLRARSATASADARVQRLLFLDAARALAIVLMVFAHFTDQLLSPALHSGPLGTIYAATRGFTAPLFFVVSGWSFALVGASDFSRRLTRAGVLLFWGYLLTLPWWAEGFPFTESTGVWLPFWTAGVLQTLGVALVLGTGLRWLAKGRSLYLGLCVALAAIALVLAPWLATASEHWPLAIRGYSDPQGVGGGFPITPWVAFFFAGSAVGSALEATPSNLFKAGALLLIACAAALAQAVMSGPDGLLVWRFACVAAVLAVAALITRSSLRLPAAARTLGQHALTFYVVHMVVLWGAPYAPGLVHRLGPTLGWLGSLAVTFGCLLATGAALWTLARARAAIGARRLRA